MKTSFETFAVTVEEKIAHISFNRPEKMNALNDTSWKELKEIFEEVDADPSVRVAILSGEGKHFSAGIDLEMLMGMQKQVENSCEGRMRENLRRFILGLQECVTAIEHCRKPVIASIHGACIGGALDIICACDMRYASTDAYFSLKEIDLAIVADLGVLQRLPKLVGEGFVREMAFTARKVTADEAAEIHLINKSYAAPSTLKAGVMETARQIATKPPLVARGLKEVLNYTRDHSVAEGLNYVATWNSSMLLSTDLQEAAKSMMMKQTPNFED